MAVFWRGYELRVWAMVVAGLLIVPALLRPGSLRRVYQSWMTVGEVLGWVNTRLILSVIFFGVFTPIGWVMRLRGQDPMRRRLEPEAETYRVVCQGRPGSHMQRQF